MCVCVRGSVELFSLAEILTVSSEIKKKQKSVAFLFVDYLFIPNPFLCAGVCVCVCVCSR